VSKTFIVDGEFNVESTGDITLESTTGTVNLQGAGGPTVFTGDVTITGDLDIQGSTTTVDTINTTIKDNMIELNSGESGAGVSLTYAGVEIDRGSLPNVNIRWNETSDEWEHTTDGSTWGTIPSSVAPGIFLTDIVQDLTPQLGGDLDVNGQSIVTTSGGNIVLAPDTTGDVLPGTDSQYDFGATGTRWATIYADTVDGTTLTGTLSTVTQNNVTTMTSLASVGALDSGSITANFGNIDNGTSNITSGGIWTIDVDGTAIGAAGSLNFGAAGNDAAIYWNGTNLEIDTTVGLDISISGTPQAVMDGSGDWNLQANNLTTTGDITATNVTGTLQTAAQPNVTSLGTLTALDIDQITINGNRISSNTTNSNIEMDPSGTGFIEMIGTNGFVPPKGTTGERPGSPSGGMTRFNTTSGKLEFWNGASWEPAGVTITGEIFGDTFTGDGSTAAFTMSQTTDNDNELFITINGVVQDPGIAYTAASNVVTFTSAPADGDSIIIRNLYAAQGVTQIIDADSDTYVQVQQLATDTDTIEFYAGSVNISDMTSTGMRLGGANARVTTILDEDAMGSDSATALATQQSIKAYVDGKNSISQGNTSITITDAGTGDINITVDGGTFAAYTVAGGANFQANNITTTGAIQGGASSGVGIARTDGTFHVHTASAGTWTAPTNFDDLVVENNTNGGIVVGVPDADEGVIGISSPSTTGAVGYGMLWDYDVGIGRLFTSKVGGSIRLDADNQIPNLTLSGGSGSELATFAGDIRLTAGDILPSASSTIQNVGSPTDKWTNMYADQFHGVATIAQYADVAERYHADAEYYPGDVVVFGGDNEITMSTLYNDHRVAGVISGAPAYMMNSEAGPNETHPYVALTGRVPCKVRGTINKGDLLVTSDIPGVAIARNVTTPFLPGTILGKALEEYDSEEVGMIEVVLGLS